MGRCTCGIYQSCSCDDSMRPEPKTNSDPSEREWLEGGSERNWLEGDVCPDCNGRGFTSWDSSGTQPPTPCDRCTPQPICEDCGAPEKVYDAQVDAMVRHDCWLGADRDVVPVRAKPVEADL